MRLFILTLLTLLSAPALAHANIADLCVLKTLSIVPLSPTMIEFTTADGVFRTVGDEAATKRMLHNLMSAMLPNAEWVNGIHVLRREGGITYVDELTYDGACRLVLLPWPKN